MEFIEIGIEEDFWVLELDTKTMVLMYIHILGKGVHTQTLFLTSMFHNSLHPRTGTLIVYTISMTWIFDRC